jgi:hypothetical protein
MARPLKQQWAGKKKVKASINGHIDLIPIEKLLEAHKP